jgi:putative membrane protein
MTQRFSKSIVASALSLLLAGLPLASYAAGTQSALTNAATQSEAQAISHSDQKFMEKAVQGGLAEVQLGSLAAQKAHSPEVKQFGQRMASDHSKANDQLKQAASQKNVNLPTDMDSSSQREFDKLQKLSDAQFDREYMKNMVSDHEKDIKEFKNESKSAKDADLKAFVDKTLPTLEDHLTQAKSAQAAANNEQKTAKTS